MRLCPLRWWDLRGLQDIERELFGADGWSESAFWSELAQSDTRYYLAAHTADAITGYAGLAAVDCGVLGAVGGAVGGEAFLQTLAVRRSSWGRGVGSALLSAVLAEAARRDAHRVLLEVRTDNLRAQALYCRFGFVEIGRRHRYYQPSGADALVMRRG